NITGGSDLLLHEVSEASNIIHDAADAEANIIFGAVLDETMKEEVKITVIATGFDRRGEAASVAAAHTMGKPSTIASPDLEIPAFALSSTLQIDAFLLDIEMPKMDGFDLCRTLRNMEGYRVAPIIFLTGHAGDNFLEQAFGCGGDDFLLKPCTATGVRSRLRNHLQRREHLQRLERMRGVLKQYLSKRTLQVVENASITGTLPPPREQDLAICFTDMRGVTAFSEETEPARLFALISETLAEQIHLIHECGGYVDKF